MMAPMANPDIPASSAATVAIDAVQRALDELRASSAHLRAFVAQARTQDVLLSSLPPRFAEVLHGLVDRLESSALFSEESCSFSQKDLLDSLQMWIDKARIRLTAPGDAS